MAAPSINTRIKLDGEREYKAALAEIKSGLNVLKSELALASEQFRDNEDSVEALTQKNDILGRTILTQKEKIEQIEKALQSSASAYGEADERTNRWKTQLNNAQTELHKMETELRDNEAALKKAQKETDGATSAFGKLKKALSDTKEQGGGIKGLFQNLKEEFSNGEKNVIGLGDAIEAITDKLGIHLPKGANSALQALNRINAGSAATVAAIGLVSAAVVKVERKLMDLTKASADAAHEIQIMSMVTGQSAESIQSFSYASEIIGVSSDRISDSLKEITNKMQDALNGNEETALAFTNLNVAITDSYGNMRKAEDVFCDTIDALGHISNQTERDAIAMDLMSESARELNPLISAGSDAMQNYAEEARDMGYVLDDAALSALNDVDNAYTRLQKTQESIQKQMSSEFAPYLKEFYEDTGSLIKDLGTALVQSGLVDAFGLLLETFVDIIAPANTLADNTVPALTQALRPLAEILAAIGDASTIIKGFGKVLFSWGWAGKIEGFNEIEQGLGANYKYGNANNLQRLHDTYTQRDTNAATEAAGYGAYYANGKYYGNRDAYLQELWEQEMSAGGAVGSFEAWKQLKGYARNASGTDYFYGGRTLVGENGPELLTLPAGARIQTASETRYTSGDTYNTTVYVDHVDDLETLLRIAKNARITARMGAK